VGAVNEASCATGVNGDQTSNSCPGSGAVYVFTRTAGIWTQQAFVKASNSSGQFGWGLALKGNTLVVGAPSEASCATGIDGNQADKGCPGAGAVYIFTRTNTLWSQIAYVKAVHPGLQSFAGSFGNILAFDGTALAVGAADNNCATGFNPSPGSNDCTVSGAVYLFNRTVTGWAQRAYVKASNTEPYDFFGAGIAIAGNTLVVGAIYEDSCATGINGNQTDNSCAHPPDVGDGFPPPTHGAGAVYVYVLQ
jgi:hypothetical protein